MVRQGLAVWTAWVLAMALASGCGPQAGAPDTAARRAERDALRRTAAVKVFQEARESAVNIGATRADAANPNVRQTEFGSGVVLHEAGYVLTNAHLLKNGGDLAVGFDGGRDYPARVVAADASKDLALLKIDAPERFKPIRLGRSEGLMVGEPVITMGNPFGMGMTVAEGIVSAIGRSTQSEFAFYPEMIQTDATTNPGSSGGPLLNIVGELVGINTTKRLGADNIAFAIPVDTIVEGLPEMLDVEGRFGFVLGMRVAMEGRPEVAAVDKGSPAEAAGIRVGDVVMRVGREPVASGVDFLLALVDCHGGQPLPMRVVRGSQFLDMTVTPRQVEPRQPDKAEGLAAGVAWAAYEGQWQTVPDVAGLTPAKTGVAATFDLGEFAGKDAFALKFTGYVEVPADGIYAFYTASDDGSRLYVGDRLVVDNDGLHPVRERRGFVPLLKGKHAVTVTIFELSGDEVLKVLWEGPGIAKQPIPASAIFHAAAGGPK